MAGHDVYQAHYHNTKAECAAKLGDWPTAERIARESLDLGIAQGSQDGVAAARVALSQVFAHRGESDAASAELTKAADIYRGLGWKAELADVLMRQSRAAQARGEHGQADRWPSLAF